MVHSPPVSDAEKREALDAVLASATFARSAQLRALLRYLCEREMAGHAEDLSEYQIAVDVLGRPKDFNLTDDSSVRNRAYELRQRLERYYSVEQPQAEVRIDVPRGGYIPTYHRQPPAPEPPKLPPGTLPSVSPSRRFGVRTLAGVAVLGVIAGAAAGFFLAQPRPASVIRQAWGPLGDSREPLLISVATNLHMTVRPHIAPHGWRFPAPEQLYTVYGPSRPLDPGAPLFMEPAQLSVPLAELSAIATLGNTREAFGGGYQLLPESEAPIAALRGRNAVLIGSATNSRTAALLLRGLPFTIDYNGTDRFAVLDQRKPPGANELFTSQPLSDPVASVQYGLITVLTTPDATGRPKRTAVFSGSGSAAVQAAVEYFCSPAHLEAMRARFRTTGLDGFPPVYQVIVRARTVGLRLISYEYAAHEAPKAQ
jgi:hypothetical protein